MNEVAVGQMMEIMKAGFDPLFGEAWNRRQLSSALAMPGTQHALIDVDGFIAQIVQRPAAGFCLSRRVVDEEELLLIAVRPDQRRRGFGGRLLAHLLRTASEAGVTDLHLEMRADNPAASLYRAFGFVPVGGRSGYYRGSDGIMRDAVTFSRFLRFGQDEMPQH
ncbi:GNAT family N-acetyltransferase [Croceicoccus sp. F390]|uniref:GNAT family N-acetyltransferase n=1 Tax=Croceicoccus esteveae TaxID=3075597 RepID=A0ABU2ZDV7_9SPHN|nr:GNAT family N-acetyltransferase [Croceicoccus sp. F390]MDT0574783.1 GNAT family N-acetyltransferase [Croceicoccus sp. F390]